MVAVGEAAPQESLPKAESQEEIDYWEQEKIKMKMAPERYQPKKKSVVSKSTSPPPQTISTQVKQRSKSDYINIQVY